VVAVPILSEVDWLSTASENDMLEYMCLTYAGDRVGIGPSYRKEVPIPLSLWSMGIYLYRKAYSSIRRWCLYLSVHTQN